MQSENDAVVAKNFGITQRLPEFGGSALARAGVSQKKMAAGFRVHQAAAVDFNTQTVCEVIGDQEFVGGIFERKNRLMVLQHFAVQGDGG